MSFPPAFDHNLLLNADQEARQNLLNQQQLLQHQAQKLDLFTPKEKVMIFFKYYDPKTSTLRYVFRMNLAINTTLNVIQETINSKMKFPPNTELLFYEEIKFENIVALKNRDMALETLRTFNRLLDGDIYAFQINEKKKLKN